MVVCTRAAHHVGAAAEVLSELDEDGAQLHDLVADEGREQAVEPRIPARVGDNMW